MITDILKKINYLDWLKSRVWIDFFMNYDSTNIYQIWNSVFNKVIWTKNIIFDKSTVFNDNIIISESDNTDSDNLDLDLNNNSHDSHDFHNSDENQL